MIVLDQLQRIGDAEAMIGVGRWIGLAAKTLRSSDAAVMTYSGCFVEEGYVDDLVEEVLDAPTLSVVASR